MSGTISVSEDVPLLTANVVPFLINHNGEANTHTYFTPSKSERANGETEAQFRGLRLIGKDCDLGNKVGYICSASEFLRPDPAAPGGAVTCKQFVATHKFEKLVVFGHEAPPPKGSKHLILCELDVVAEAVHS